MLNKNTQEILKLILEHFDDIPFTAKDIKMYKRINSNQLVHYLNDLTKLGILISEDNSKLDTYVYRLNPDAFDKFE